MGLGSTLQNFSAFLKQVDITEFSTHIIVLSKDVT